jgi:hypothetical protein
MLKVTSGNSFEYIVCTRQHELKSNFLWIRDHGRDQEWHVVKLRQTLLIKTQIVEIWITA